MYRSKILRQPESVSKLVAPKNNRDSLSGSGEYTEIDWASYGVPLDKNEKNDLEDKKHNSEN